jgi:hypothetical protein
MPPRERSGIAVGGEVVLDSEFDVLSVADDGRDMLDYALRSMGATTGMRVILRVEVVRNG